MVPRSYRSKDYRHQSLPLIGLGLLLVLLAVCARAQFSVPQQPIFANAPSTGDGLPPGIMFRWVASDLADGAVAAWPDRIQNRYLAQTTGANQPTKETNSVIFNGSQWLQVTNAAPLNTHPSATDPTNAFLVVASIDTAGSTRFLMSPGAPGATTDAWLWRSLANNWRVTVNNDIAPSANGRYLEYLCPGSDGASTYHYTNGVFSRTADGFANVFSFLGIRADGSFPWIGTVKEIIIWTNTADTLFTAPQIAAVHFYVTNTYGAAIFQ